MEKQVIEKLLGRIITIIEFQPGKKRVNVEVDGVIARTFVVENNINSKRWEKVKPKDCLLGLEWFDKEAKIIDADSQFTILK